MAKRETPKTTAGGERFFNRDVATLDDGRKVSVFVNLETNLIVVDLIAADESGGVEILRYRAGGK